MKIKLRKEWIILARYRNATTYHSMSRKNGTIYSSLEEAVHDLKLMQKENELAEYQNQWIAKYSRGYLGYEIRPDLDLYIVDWKIVKRYVSRWQEVKA